MRGDSDLRPVLKLLQITGVAPYVLGKDDRSSKVSLFLVAYNLVLVVAVTYNVIRAETDPKNDVDYANKSFLIAIAFDVVDVLENIHFCFVSIRSVLFTKVGTRIWFRLQHVEKKLLDLNVEFDERKFKKYFYLKTGVFLGFSLIFLAFDIYLCTRLELYYTPNYWVTCAVPLVFNSAVSATFGGMLLVVYQRFWVVNEYLNRFAEQETSEGKREHGNPGGGHWRRENVLLGNNPGKNPPVSRPGKKVRVRPVEEAPAGKAPGIVMMKNYQECFGKDFLCKRATVGALRSLKILHFDLFEVVNDLNSIFGWNLLFVFTASFFGCTINTYFVIIFHLRPYEVEQYVSCLFWTSLYIFKVLYFTIHATKVTQELKAFCLQISQCKVEFKAAEFFKVDRAILFQVFSATWYLSFSSIKSISPKNEEIKLS